MVQRNTNTSWLTNDEKQALQGTYGNPDGDNRFVTNSDPRIGGTTGGGTPSDTVVPETGFGNQSAPGSGTAYSRGDHTHGSSANPVSSHESSYNHSLLHAESHNHDTAYEAKNSNIQTHVTSTHAPTDAQKNSDITKAEIEAKLTGELTSHTHAGGSTVGYSLQVRAASQSTTTDSQTLYWGGMLVAPSTTANRWRVYIPKTGTIKAAYIYSYAGTAGTNENWSMNIRYDNTTDTLIETKGVNTNDRVWSNTSLDISVTQGHYIEIKEVQPAWATNPATVTRTGIIYIE